MSPGPPSSPSAPPAPPRLNGARVVVAGLVSGAAGLAIAFFLRAIAAHTPTQLSSRSLFWSTVLLGAAGMGAGMAVAAVQQLRQLHPDPAYRHSPGLRPKGQGERKPSRGG